jgi:hypothetical protein
LTQHEQNAALFGVNVVVFIAMIVLSAYRLNRAARAAA